MTDTELLEYSRQHLHYEVWMLDETAGRLLHAPLHFDRVMKNTTIESFSIHARALTSFLYPDKCQHRPTDVAADDYATDWLRVRGDDLPVSLLTASSALARRSRISPQVG